MSVSPFLKVLIVMNNYFHDVATAMLLSSALILWLIGRYVIAEGRPEALAWFAGAYRILTRIAVFSIIWIIMGGIPRTVFFEQVEWNLADPSNKYLFSALMVKHAVMWIAVAAGIALWVRMRKLVRSFEAPAAIEGRD